MTMLPDVSEAEASETVRTIYDEIKATLQISFVPQVFRRLGSDERLFSHLWDALEPVLTNRMERAADQLRAAAVEEALAWEASTEWPADPIDDVRETIDILHDGTPRTLLAAVVLREALTHGSLEAASRVVWPQARGVPRGMPRVRLVAPDEAEERIQAQYREIQTTLELPAVTDEWRALAAWPDALEAGWEAVRTLAGGEAYPATVARLAEQATEHGRALQRPVRDLSPEALQARGVDPAQQQAIRDTVEAFVPALARQTAHTAFWMGQLVRPAEAKLPSRSRLRKWSVPQGFRTPTIEI